MAAIAQSTTMQRFRTFYRVNLLGTSLALLTGLGLLSFFAALLIHGFGKAASGDPHSRDAAEQRFTFLESSGFAATINEWWKSGQANFWQQPPTPSEDSRALNQLISWRANPSVLSHHEISDLSLFLLEKSQQYQLSPVLVLSMIEVESSFRKAAVSSKGAVGMMQLMPGTAQQMAKLSGLEWKGASVLEDPKSNIEFGLRYMVYLKRHFSEPEHILTAYNIGPYALKKKLQSGEVPPRGYYNRVMGTVKAYQQRAKSNRARPGLWANSWL